MTGSSATPASAEAGNCAVAVLLSMNVVGRSWAQSVGWPGEPSQAIAPGHMSLPVNLRVNGTAPTCELVVPAGLAMAVRTGTVPGEAVMVKGSSLDTVLSG